MREGRTEGKKEGAWTRHGWPLLPTLVQGCYSASNRKKKIFARVYILSSRKWVNEAFLDGLKYHLSVWRKPPDADHRLQWLLQYVRLLARWRTVNGLVLATFRPAASSSSNDPSLPRRTGRRAMNHDRTRPNSSILIVTIWVSVTL